MDREDRGLGRNGRPGNEPRARVQVRGVSPRRAVDTPAVALHVPGARRALAALWPVRPAEHPGRL
eukprot:994280-Alexandrium_andersonii.AAC.1